MRQYVSIKFRPNDRRSYLYHWDGDPVEPGDMVKVPGKHADDGWTPLKVLAVTFDAPSFATKAILGKAPPVPLDVALIEAGVAVPHNPDAFRDYVEDVRSGLAGPDLFGDA